MRIKNGKGVLTAASIEKRTEMFIGRNSLRTIQPAKDKENLVSQGRVLRSSGAKDDLMKVNKVVPKKIQIEKPKSPPMKKKTLTIEQVKKIPAKKEPAKKEPAKKEIAKKVPNKKEPVEKEPAKKQLVKREPAKKQLAKKESPKNEPAKKETAKKSPVAVKAAKSPKEKKAKSNLKKVEKIEKNKVSSKACADCEINLNNSARSERAKKRADSLKTGKAEKVIKGKSAPKKVGKTKANEVSIQASVYLEIERKDLTAAGHTKEDWKAVAEQRATQLSDALIKNEQLHVEKAQLQEEAQLYSDLLDQARNLIESLNALVDFDQYDIDNSVEDFP